mmetsp:Transcript_37883/g.67900  ORF Transcript_37883/g.67900 Transcript_37883/m.67900 type:complete len:250 (+) Transcript_37883:712-1461(+)
MPLATVFANARDVSVTESASMKKNGSAPKPVVMHVSQPYAKTRRDSYIILSISCMDTTSVETAIHNMPRPRENLRLNQGQASIFDMDFDLARDASLGLGAVASAALGDVESVRPKSLVLAWCRSLLTFSRQFWPTLEHTCASRKAHTAAMQPLVSSMKPLRSVSRLPAVRPRSPPKIRRVSALIPRALNVENCGRYHCGPMYFASAMEIVTPSKGTTPKPANDAEPAMLSFAGVPGSRGMSNPSSSTIM